MGCVVPSGGEDTDPSVYHGTLLKIKIVLDLPITQACHNAPGVEYLSLLSPPRVMQAL